MSSIPVLRIQSVLVFLAGFAAACVFLPRAGDAADQPPAVLKSRIITLKETPENKGDWGVMRPYFVGDTSGTKRVFTASATVLPGRAVHAAHRHAEEEYLLLTEGSGTWHLDGKETPASTGDLLYVEPWVYHGLRNTGDKPLTFFVVKFHPAGMKLPERPVDSRPDELKNCPPTSVPLVGSRERLQPPSAASWPGGFDALSFLSTIYTGICRRYIRGYMSRVQGRAGR